MNGKHTSNRARSGATLHSHSSSQLKLDPARTADRDQLFPMHPVITRGFHIATPPLRRAFKAATEIIASGAPGCAFVAFPRFGKTYASEYFDALLREAFPATPIILFCARHHTRMTERQFCTELLRQTSAGAILDRFDIPLSQVSRAWWIRAAELQARKLIVIGDEMQCMTPDGYSWLLDVTNELHRLKLRTILILFGQPELVNLRSVFLHTNRGDILGRFLSRLYAFDGIASALDLRQVMHAYDDPTELEYPAGSNWSFTRFFVPQAYKQGWRLASCALECWEQFRKLSLQRLKSSERTGKLSIGMEWVAGAIQHFLVYSADFDCPDIKVSPENWRHAIEKSGFLESLGLTYDPQWAPLP